MTTTRLPTIEASLYAALGCTEIKLRRGRAHLDIDAVATQLAAFVRESSEYQKLIAIEAAARAWRKSFEDDDWTDKMIEATRDGIPELMRLLRS